MALREFMDSRGLRWKVWETVPDRRILRAEFLHGWLTFELGQTRRRLAPIPEGWAALPDTELAELCARARPERARRRLVE